jgi:hypothetical protein
VQAVERKYVAPGAKAAQYAERGRRHIGVVPEGLAAKDVGKMDLDHGHLCRDKSVEESD